MPDVKLNAIPNAAGEGIHQYLGRIFRKVVEREEMPPYSRLYEMTPAFTQEDRNAIGEWILGGAPGAPGP